MAASIGSVRREQRMLNTKTVRIARSRLPALRLRLIELINSFVDETAGDAPADCVYQVHASLIPLATAEGEGEADGG